VLLDIWKHQGKNVLRKEMVLFSSNRPEFLQSDNTLKMKAEMLKKKTKKPY
jgi:hypothetical protein